MALIIKKFRALFGFRHRWILGDLSVPAWQPCLPGVGLPAERTQQPLGREHFFPIISAKAPGLPCVGLAWSDASPRLL